MAPLKQDDKSSCLLRAFPPVSGRSGEVDEKGDLDSKEISNFRKILLKFKYGIRKASALTHHQSNIILSRLTYHLFGLFCVKGNWFFNHIGHSQEDHHLP